MACRSSFVSMEDVLLYSIDSIARKRGHSHRRKCQSFRTAFSSFNAPDERGDDTVSYPCPQAVRLATTTYRVSVSEVQVTNVSSWSATSTPERPDRSKSTSLRARAASSICAMVSLVGLVISANVSVLASAEPAEITAVSYTHLDVYKRQVQRNRERRLYTGGRDLLGAALSVYCVFVIGDINSVCPRALWLPVSKPQTRSCSSQHVASLLCQSKFPVCPGKERCV